MESKEPRKKRSSQSLGPAAFPQATAAAGAAGLVHCPVRAPSQPARSPRAACVPDGAPGRRAAPKRTTIPSRPRKFPRHRGVRVPQHGFRRAAPDPDPRRPSRLRGREDAPAQHEGRERGHRQRPLALRRPLGADEDELAFLYATSGAENIIVSAMDWRAGDNVVVDELHFTTTFVLYRELERRCRDRTEDRPLAGGRRHRRRLRRAHRRTDAPDQRGMGLEPERLPLRPAASGRPRARPRRLSLRRRNPGVWAPSPPTFTTRTSTSPAATGTSGCTPTSGALPSTCAASTWSG